MSKSYSTPTVSFADRCDFQPRKWSPPNIAQTYRSQSALGARGRGFYVSRNDILLMSMWLRGKL